jgi:hypothetical protein
MDHNWQRLFGLSCMPLAFRLRNATGCEQFVFLPYGMTPESLAPPNAVKGDQPFFAFSSDRI